METREVVFGLNETDEIAERVLTEHQNERIFFLKGELGAGKTTLIKSFCKRLGVESGLSSPTFSIVNEYQTSSGAVVYHMDLYRLKNIAEAQSIGIEEYLDSGNYCFVEWPDIIEPYFKATVLQLDKIGESLRKLCIFNS